jgi:hypothetical protein
MLERHSGPMTVKHTPRTATATHLALGLLSMLACNSFLGMHRKPVCVVMSISSSQHKQHLYLHAPGCPSSCCNPPCTACVLLSPCTQAQPVTSSDPEQTRLL